MASLIPDSEIEIINQWKSEFKVRHAIFDHDGTISTLIMGYAHLFEGGIYGSVGDVNKEAKKMVLDRTLDQIGEAAFGEVIAFGDGPVGKRTNGVVSRWVSVPRYQGEE